MSDAVTIDGLNELSDLLATLPAKAAKRYLSRCAEPAAQVVIDAGEETVPVNSGILAGSLDWQKKWSSDAGETAIEITIGPLKHIFWGSLQEFGTHDQPAQHWLSRAWMGCRDECQNVFVTEAIGLLQDLENKKG